MAQDSDLTKKPKQARALKTEQRLLDALELLLSQKSFSELTVAELAKTAGVTTGAIYRRFTNKEDVLRAAFYRLLERTRMAHDAARPQGMSDRQLLVWYLRQLMEFAHDNVDIMRAANSLNDIDSFDRMNLGRAIGADWLADAIHSSSLPQVELNKRCRFVLRVATATFRDTFLWGRGSVPAEGADQAAYEAKLERLCENLAAMAARYLILDKDQSSYLIAKDEQ